MISQTLFSLYAMLRKGSDFYDRLLRILRIEIFTFAYVYFQRWWRREINLWKNMKQRRSIFLLFCQLYIMYISSICYIVVLHFILSNERFYIFDAFFHSLRVIPPIPRNRRETLKFVFKIFNFWKIMEIIQII